LAADLPLVYCTVTDAGWNRTNVRLLILVNAELILWNRQRLSLVDGLHVYQK